MYPTTAWHSDGLRWLANVLTELADFMDRTDSALGGRAYVSPDEACTDARARYLPYRYY